MNISGEYQYYAARFDVSNGSLIYAAKDKETGDLVYFNVGQDEDTSAERKIPVTEWLDKYGDKLPHDNVFIIIPAFSNGNDLKLIDDSKGNYAPKPSWINPVKLYSIKTPVKNTLKAEHCTFVGAFQYTTFNTTTQTPIAYPMFIFTKEDGTFINAKFDEIELEK